MLIRLISGAFYLPTITKVDSEAVMSFSSGKGTVSAYIHPPFPQVQPINMHPVRAKQSEQNRIDEQRNELSNSLYSETSNNSETTDMSAAFNKVLLGGT